MAKTEKINNILVAEANKAIRDQINTILSDMGYNVTIVSKGEEAIEQIELYKFMIVIIDLLIPDIKGLELLKRIRDINNNISIIVLTNNQNIGIAIQALKSGAYDYIKIPCDIDELEVIIKRAIERCELLKESEYKDHYKHSLIAKLINDTRSSDESVRRLAAEDLGEIATEEAVDALIELFKDESIAVQEAAESALIKINGEYTVKKVVPMLKAKEANLRNFAAEILTSIGKKAMPVLAGLLTDNDHDIRKFAVDLLGSIGCKETVPLLIRALDDPHINVSAGAAEALGNIRSEEAIDSLIGKLNGESWLVYSAIESLGKIGDKRAVEPLINLPCKGDEVIMTSKVRALGAIGDSRATFFLLSLFDKGDDYLKGMIVRAFDQIWERTGKDIFGSVLMRHKIIKNLIPMLKKDDAETRLSAINMLAKMRYNKVLDSLLSCLTDLNEDVRDAAYQAIITIGISSDNIDLFIHGLKTMDDELKLTILRIFGETRCQAAGDAVAGLLKNDPNPAIREEAADTLCMLIDKRKYVPALIDALKDSSIEVRNAAIHSLGIILDPIAIEPIVLLLGNEATNNEAVNALIRIGGERTFELVLPMLKDNNHLCRQAAITILGSLRHKDIKIHLSEALQDQDWKIRKIAVDIIAQRRDETFIDDLIIAINDEDKFVQIAVVNALERFNDTRLIEPLITALHHRDERVRYGAVQAIMKYRDVRVNDSLIQMLSDHSNMVKIITVEALGKIGDKAVIPYIENMLETVEADELYEAANMALERLKGEK